MKRVQLILEAWQYDWIVERGEAEGKTISALVRELLTEAIERKQVDVWQDDPIWGIVGLGAGPDDGISSENLDEFLYPQIYTHPESQGEGQSKSHANEDSRQYSLLYPQGGAKPTLMVAEDEADYSG